MVDKRHGLKKSEQIEYTAESQAWIMYQFLQGVDPQKIMKRLKIKTKAMGWPDVPSSFTSTAIKTMSYKLWSTNSGKREEDGKIRPQKILFRRLPSSRRGQPFTEPENKAFLHARISETWTIDVETMMVLCGRSRKEVLEKRLKIEKKETPKLC